MLVLSARQLDAEGRRYEFYIEMEGAEAIRFTAKEDVVEKLRELGVNSAEKAVTHACDWGLIEIVEVPPPSRFGGQKF
jgi:hypothetical protein